MATVADTPAADLPAPSPPGRVYYRHRVITRLTHWTNVVAMVFLIATGLNIFNAHPSLYWGKFGANPDDHARWFEIGAVDAPGGVAGMTRIGPVTIDTSGLLGTHRQPDGAIQQQGLPRLGDVPDQPRPRHRAALALLLRLGLHPQRAGVPDLRRRITGHLQRDVWPRLRQLAPANIWHDIVRHAKLDFPRGEDDKHYHILAAHRLCRDGLRPWLPLMVLTGLSMSPGFNAALGGALPSLFGGRASARSLHFITMDLTIAFIVIHVAMVILAGPYNQIRSMVTGRYDVGIARRGKEHSE